MRTQSQPRSLSASVRIRGPVHVRNASYIGFVTLRSARTHPHHRRRPAEGLAHCASRASAPISGECFQAACGVIAAPLFVASFTAIGAKRVGYDWQRYPVSSLADGQSGWLQRVNFVLTGLLYCIAAHGLARSPKRLVGPRVVPALLFGVGVGLVGSGVFVTDPVAGFPPAPCSQDGADPTSPATPTRSGKLHNLCAVPIFVGIPVAALTSAASAARGKQGRWASYSAASAVAMMGSFVLFGRAFGGATPSAGRGGIFQRISIVTGFGWLSALSLRAAMNGRPTRLEVRSPR